MEESLSSETQSRLAQVKRYGLAADAEGGRLRCTLRSGQRLR